MSFINKLQYKAEEVGIEVIVNEESYTSKASFLNGDKMEKDFEFSGARISRGLYKTKNGILINVDVNGVYNIIRKVFPDEFKRMSDGISGALVHPVRLNICA